ncbi:exodeoxyribonuclease VII small subunit [Isoptericola sp. NPDC019693]|uniref:exodeoxyribonuclease VII small subunit n=1 Tax=Isoptericola sp. NPDC019693 TaxID=3364009 RepID=UPI0037B3207A
MTDANPTPDLPADVAALSYEEARDELVQVVARLEAGSEPLEASLALWERGEALAARCQQWLDGARERLAAAQAASSATPSGADGTDGTDEDEEDDA